MHIQVLRSQPECEVSSSKIDPASQVPPVILLYMSKPLKTYHIWWGWIMSTSGCCRRWRTFLDASGTNPARWPGCPVRIRVMGARNMGRVTDWLIGGLVAIFYFPINIGLLIIPIDEVIFFRGVALAHQPVGGFWRIEHLILVHDGPQEIGWFFTMNKCASILGWVDGFNQSQKCLKTKWPVTNKFG